MNKLQLALSALLVLSTCNAYSYSVPKDLRASGPVDPFAHSGCDCDRFCDYKCSINATEPANMTIYRMTMQGVLDLTDKDTGDVSGDTSFVISRRDYAAECRKHPDSWQCVMNMAPFSGDDENSTDLVLEMQIEVDGQWGPYLECNPLNDSDPLGEWNCSNGLHIPPPADYPKQCIDAHYQGFLGSNILDKQKDARYDISLAECCEYAGDTGYSLYQYNKTSRVCQVFEDSLKFGYNGKDTIIGRIQPPQAPKCECERVYKTVGKEDLKTNYGKQFTPGGTWYSHPRAGQCLGDQKIGDGSGCTYKLHQTSKAIMAKCMYEEIDKAVEKANPLCFRLCHKPFEPLNKTSDCYLGCYYATTYLIASEKQLTKPWYDAFNGACPLVSNWQEKIRVVQPPGNRWIRRIEKAEEIRMIEKIEDRLSSFIQ